MSGDSCVVSFDLDDTLYPHRQYVTAGFEAAAEVVRERTGEDIYDDLVTAYFGDGEYARTFDVVLESRDIPTGMVEELVGEYHDVVGNLSPYPDVRPTLDMLAASHKLALITDGKNTTKKLEKLNLSEYFEFVFRTDTREFTKRADTPFQKLLDHFGLKPDQTVYVGNDPRVDFRQPNRLGMHTVRLRRGTLASMEPPDEESVPDYVIEKLNVLPDVVRCLND